MTGRQHAAIGLGLALPLGVQVAGSPVAGQWTPGWTAAAGLPAGLVLTALVVAGALAGALLPDLDSERSLLESAPRHVLRRLRRRWWFWPLAPLLIVMIVGLWLVNETIMLVSNHRGLTHSLTALLLVLAGSWLALAWVVGPAPTVGLAAGYISHLAADSLTPRGVQLLAPWSRRHWHLLPWPARFGGASWRAGCLTTLVLVGGVGLTLWQLWMAFHRR